MSNTENFNRGARESLPERKKGFTQKMTVDSVKAYIRTGEYSDGRLAEVFVDVKDDDLGEEARAFINNFAISISIGLQHGVPLEVYMDAFCFDGSAARTKNVEGAENIDKAVHIIDAVFQVLRETYCPKPTPPLVPDHIAKILKLSDFRP